MFFPKHNANMTRIPSSVRKQSTFVAKPLSGYVYAAYKSYVQINIDALPEGWPHDRIMAEINTLGVSCFSGSCSAVYLEKSF